MTDKQRHTQICIYRIRCRHGETDNTDAEKHRETVADRHMQIDRQKQKHKHKKKETMEIDGNGERGI